MSFVLYHAVMHATGMAPTLVPGTIDGIRPRSRYGLAPLGFRGGRATRRAHAPIAVL